MKNSRGSSASSWRGEAVLRRLRLRRPERMHLPRPRVLVCSCHRPCREFKGRENLATFLKRFRTWACLHRCGSALDSETVVNTTGTPRAELEKLHEYSLVENSLKAWQALTKALEKEKEIMGMIIDIGSLSEAWRALTKIAAETQVAAYDRAKREFESLEIGVNEPVAKHFAQVHVILMKLARHQVTARPARRRLTSQSGRDVVPSRDVAVPINGLLRSLTISILIVSSVFVSSILRRILYFMVAPVAQLVTS